MLRREITAVCSGTDVNALCLCNVEFFMLDLVSRAVTTVPWGVEYFVKTSTSVGTLSFLACIRVVKVKGILVQTLRLCTGRTAHRGSRVIALLFLGHGIRRGWGVSVTPRPLFIFGKYQVPIVQEAGWAPGPVWTGAENLAPTGIRSPDRPARGQSLYRLSYLAHIRSASSPYFSSITTVLFANILVLIVCFSPCKKTSAWYLTLGYDHFQSLLSQLTVRCLALIRHFAFWITDTVVKSNNENFFIRFGPCFWMEPVVDRFCHHV